MSDAPISPPAVTEAATESIDLPGRSPILLGTFGTNGSGAALLRLRGGATTQVEVGDEVEGYDVAAIAPGEVTLARAGRTRQLRLP